MKSQSCSRMYGEARKMPQTIESFTYKLNGSTGFRYASLGGNPAARRVSVRGLAR